jgi:hypothetical protein
LWMNAIDRFNKNLQVCNRTFWAVFLQAI